MVAELGPVKFYGSSLPRPRFYTDVKYNAERVDPPLPVNDALLNWAHEAHWSMGGVNFTRHRFQGRIEGNVEKLRAQREKEFKKIESPKLKKKTGKKKIGESPSPPKAPLALKRRRVLGLVEEDDEEEERVSVRRGAVRKLGGEFERVARESGMVVDKDIEEESVVVARRTRSKREEVGKEEVKKGKKKLLKVGDKLAKIGGKMVTRSSPRLTKN